VTQPVFRFAPSPNGLLHLGHAYSALLNESLARRFGGRLLLRIENIDVARCRSEHEQALYRDLAWLGLSWEQPVRRQAVHFETYRAAAAGLAGRGLLFPCFCSRRDVAAAVARLERGTGREWPRDPDGAPLYPGTCRRLPPGEAERRIASGAAHAWRIDMAAAHEAAPGPHAYLRFASEEPPERVAASPDRWDGAVIVRSDIPTSYHLSVVVDDALQGVTHVVRGRDLEAATDLHVMLQALLGLPPPLYHHHGLIRDPQGGKLSKSLRSEALADLRSRGVTAAQIRERLSFR
jgi:glutamyl-Q tRNA(Asp) synthetase